MTFGPDCEQEETSMIPRGRLLVIVVFIAALATVADSQERPEIQVRTVKAAENVYMLAGAGGNLALSVGDDGALLVDSEHAQLAEKVTAAVKEVCKAPTRFVINTHWHFDHVGGNENLAEAGVLVVAHENVRKRMSSERSSSRWVGRCRRRPPRRCR